MRHRLARRHLNRDTAHRMAMLNNMVVSLVTHEQIITTVAKAKELRRYIEPMVTKARNSTPQTSLHVRRQLLARLYDSSAVEKMMTTLAKRYRDRPGGYTRIMRAGYRYGDNAPRGVIEFVDRDEQAKGAPQRNQQA